MRRGEPWVYVLTPPDLVEQVIAHRQQTQTLARTLNALGVIPPSAHDRARNSHRTGAAWTLRTVAAILANPRYTGRQIWNRQSIDHHESNPGDKTSREPGRRPTHG